MKITILFIILSVALVIGGCPFSSTASDGSGDPFADAVFAQTENKNTEIVTLPKLGYTWQRFGPKKPFSDTLRGGFGK